MRIPYGDGELEVTVNIHTAVIYEQQFESDMVGDVIGKVELGESSDELRLDFTKTNWTATMRAIWAGASEADPTFPPFEVFERNHKDLNLMLCSSLLQDEIVTRFFSATRPRSEEAETEAM